MTHSLLAGSVHGALATTVRPAAEMGGMVERRQLRQQGGLAQEGPRRCSFID
jgi:hypothetical protein